MDVLLVVHETISSALTVFCHQIWFLERDGTCHQGDCVDSKLLFIGLFGQKQSSCLCVGVGVGVSVCVSECAYLIICVCVPICLCV